MLGGRSRADRVVFVTCCLRAQRCRILGRDFAGFAGLSLQSPVKPPAPVVANAAATLRCRYTRHVGDRTDARVFLFEGGHWKGGFRRLILAPK